MGAGRGRGARRPLASVQPALPVSADPSAHAVLDLALRMSAIVDLARSSDGGAISAGEATARAAVLRDLDDAARRAVEAVCSPPAA